MGDNGTTFNALAAREFYEERGFEPIPLPPNSKNPAWLGKRWQARPIAQLWRLPKVARAAQRANIGLRFTPNGYNRTHHVVIDCDDKEAPGTAANVTRALAGLGVDAPVIATASGSGRHVYLTCEDVPSAITRPNLAREVGKGQFFVRSGQVVAPWSVVDNGVYRLLSGNWDVRPSVAYADIGWMFDAMTTTADYIAAGEDAGAPIALVKSIPVRLLWRPMPVTVWHGFELLKVAERGAPITLGNQTYPTRSEAEAAIVAKLALCGWDFDAIAATFRDEQPGHFIAQKSPMGYLRTTYTRAVRHIVASPTRQAIAAQYQDATVSPWPGRTGSTDAKVYAGVLADMFAADATTSSIAVREVAEHAAVQPKTASKALTRLARQGLIKRGKDATVYRAGTVSLQMTTRVTCPGAYDTCSHLETPHPELWRARGLGASARLVFTHLDAGAVRSVAELCARTGKARPTVYKALKKLKAVQLAVRVVGGWLRGLADAGDVADELKCDERARRRRAEHARQRKDFRDGVSRRVKREQDAAAWKAGIWRPKS